MFHRESQESFFFFLKQVKRKGYQKKKKKSSIFKHLKQTNHSKWLKKKQFRGRRLSNDSNEVNSAHQNEMLSAQKNLTLEPFT